MSFPCIKCDKNVAKNAKAVRCLFCELWIHKECAGISDENFKFICDQQAMNGGHMWACKSCKAGSYLFEKKLSELEDRIATTEQATKENKERSETNAKDIKDIQVKLDKIPEEQLSLAENKEDAVFAELQDRDYRKANLIIHKLQEPSSSLRNPQERKEKDIERVMKVLKEIKCENINFEEDVKFCVRIGEKSKDPNKVRPLLIGFRDHSSGTTS